MPCSDPIPFPVFLEPEVIALSHFSTASCQSSRGHYWEMRVLLLPWQRKGSRHAVCTQKLPRSRALTLVRFHLTNYSWSKPNLITRTSVLKNKFKMCLWNICYKQVLIYLTHLEKAFCLFCFVFWQNNSNFSFVYLGGKICLYCHPASASLLGLEACTSAQCVHLCIIKNFYYQYCFFWIKIKLVQMDLAGNICWNDWFSFPCKLEKEVTFLPRNTKEKMTLHLKVKALTSVLSLGNLTAY